MDEPRKNVAPNSSEEKSPNYRSNADPEPQIDMSENEEKTKSNAKPHSADVERTGDRERRGGFPAGLKSLSTCTVKDIIDPLKPKTLIATALTDLLAVDVSQYSRSQSVQNSDITPTPSPCLSSTSELPSYSHSPSKQHQSPTEEWKCFAPLQICEAFQNVVSSAELADLDSKNTLLKDEAEEPSNTKTEKPFVLSSAISKRRLAALTRLKLTPSQRSELEEEYADRRYAKPEFVKSFEIRHGIPKTKIKCWFQNRRSKDRRKHHENFLQKKAEMEYKKLKYPYQPPPPPPPYPINEFNLYNQHYVGTPKTWAPGLSPVSYVHSADQAQYSTASNPSSYQTSAYQAVLDYTRRSTLSPLYQPPRLYGDYTGQYHHDKTQFTYTSGPVCQTPPSYRPRPGSQTYLPLATMATDWYPPVTWPTSGSQGYFMVKQEIDESVDDWKEERLTSTPKEQEFSLPKRRFVKEEDGNDELTNDDSGIGIMSRSPFEDSLEVTPRYSFDLCRRTESGYKPPLYSDGTGAWVNLSDRSGAVGSSTCAQGEGVYLSYRSGAMEYGSSLSKQGVNLCNRPAGAVGSGRCLPGEGVNFTSRPGAIGSSTSGIPGEEVNISCRPGVLGAASHILGHPSMHPSTGLPPMSLPEHQMSNSKTDTGTSQQNSIQQNHAILQKLLSAERICSLLCNEVIDFDNTVDEDTQKTQDDGKENDEKQSV